MPTRLKQYNKLFHQIPLSLLTPTSSLQKKRKKSQCQLLPIESMLQPREKEIYANPVKEIKGAGSEPEKEKKILGSVMLCAKLRTIEASRSGHARS